MSKLALIHEPHFSCASSQRRGGGGLGERDGLDVRVVADQAVERAQKFASRARVEFPGVLAVEDDGNGQRLRGWNAAMALMRGEQVGGGVAAGNFWK